MFEKTSLNRVVGSSTMSTHSILTLSSPISITLTFEIIVSGSVRIVAKRRIQMKGRGIFRNSVIGNRILRVIDFTFLLNNKRKYFINIWQRVHHHDLSLGLCK